MRELDDKAFGEATKRIASWKRPLLISHVKPDGDALGALVAMRSLLRSQSVKPRAVLFDAIPERYALFRRYHAMPVLGRDIGMGDLDDFDGVIILDTCSYTQLTPVADWLRSTPLEKLAVDHHVTRDDLADGYLIDETAPATCVILYDWVRVAGWSVAPEVNEALFVGIAMDTGWFRHSNTDRRVLTAAADLVARGVAPHEFYEQLHQRETPARIRLLGAALNTLELIAGDRLAIMTLPSRAFVDCGATTADTEDIVNEPLRIGSVVVSVLLVDDGSGIVRVSFRSKPQQAGLPSIRDATVRERGGKLVPTKSGGRADVATKAPQANDDGASSTSARVPHPSRSEGGGTDAPVDIDVAEVARAFGGGGHTRAAGARVHGSLPDVRRKIVAHLSHALTV